MHCMNVCDWANVKTVKSFEWSSRLEKRYINTIYHLQLHKNYPIIKHNTELKKGKS